MWPLRRRAASALPLALTVAVVGLCALTSPVATASSAPSMTVTSAAAAAPAADKPVGDSTEDLRQALDDSPDGTLRVIVSLAVGVRPEADLNGPQRDAQRATVADAQDTLESILASTGSVVATRYPIIPAAVAVVDAAGLDALLADPRVDGVTLDREVPLALEESTEIIGSNALHAAGVTGRGPLPPPGNRFMVAVLDSGVDGAHLAFEDRILAEACYADPDPLVPGGACPNDQATQNGFGAAEACDYVGCDHGTHVAGIAVGAAAYGGHAGVAPDAGLAAIQVGFPSQVCAVNEPVPCWRANVSDIDLALLQVLTWKEGGRDIVAANLSLGAGVFATACNGTYDSTFDAAAQLAAADVAIVAAAGNDGATTGVSYPACLSNVYAVSASDDDDQRAPFSNIHAQTDWYAPGVGITAPVPLPFQIGTKSGTSMAAPHVSGAMALLRQCVDGNDDPLSTAGAAADLNATDVPISGTGIVTRGRIDVLAAATSNVNNNDFGPGVPIEPVVPANPGTNGYNDPDFNVCADAEDWEQGGPFTVENSAWWSWTPWVSGNATISTASVADRETTFDTELALYQGTAPQNLALVDWNDDAAGQGRTSLVTTPVVGGTTYWIQLDGKNAASGLVNLQVRLQPVCQGLPATRFGSPNNDTLNGTTGADVLVTGGGNDTVNGLGGNDVICAGTGNDTVNGGEGNDTIVADEGTDAANGDGGSDTVDYATSATAVQVDLGAGTTTGGLGPDTLASVENVVGSGSADTLKGSPEPNALTGNGGVDTLAGLGGADDLNAGEGDDRLTGGPGNDTLSGGPGIDTASYATAAGTVQVDLGAGAASGSDGNDALDTIENATGSDFDDELTGSAGANTLTGGAGGDSLAGLGATDTLDAGEGDDTLTGGTGDDTLIGGLGADTAVYTGAPAGVRVDLGAGEASGGDGADTLTDVENAIGSDHSDELTGSDASNILTGAGGVDIQAGLGGADTLDGGEGDDLLIGGPAADQLSGGPDIDTASYADAPAAVRVDLVNGKAEGGGGTDELASIENATGSQHDDTLIGNTEPNTLTGGGGIDTTSYATAPSAVQVDLGTGVVSGGDGRDTLSGLENAIGSAHNDTLVGSPGANAITGEDGDDRIAGRAGNDDLDGGGGADTASYSTAAAAVSVNLTSGAATGADGTDRLRGMEHAAGSPHGDRLTGSTAANTLRGGAGDDTLSGGAGNDTLDGQSGVDTVTYAANPAAVRVNLSSSTAVGAGTDRVGAENATGTAFSDVLTGSSVANILAGGSGDDTLVGNAGNDRLSGGAGVDTVSYAAVRRGVALSLVTGRATGDGTDVLSLVENAVGTAFADSLSGSSAANRLTGGAAADQILGAGGPDALSGSGGRDDLRGGTGRDALAGGTGRDTCAGGAGRDSQTSCERRAGIP